MPGGADMNAELEAAAAECAAAGGRPYVIPGGGSNTSARWAMSNCAQELVTQANDIGLEIDHSSRHRQRRHPRGPGGGPGAMSAASPCSASASARRSRQQEANVFKLAQAHRELLGHRAG